MNKKILIVIAVVMVAAILTFTLVGCNNGISDKLKDWFPDDGNNEEPTEDPNNNEPVDKFVAVGDASVYMEQGQTYAMPMLLSFNEPVAEASESYTASVTLTATVKPEEALNKEVDWSVSWNNAPTYGKNDISSYLTVTPQSDGSNVATVTCHQAFGSDTATITVTTRVGGYTATCQVIYEGKATSIYVNVDSGTHVVDSGWNNTSIYELSVGRTYTYNICGNNDFGQVGKSFSPKYECTYVSNGTFLMYDGYNINPSAYGTVETTLDGFINNEEVLQYDTYVKKNSYISITIQDNKLVIVPKNTCSGLVDMKDISGRGYTGKRFASYPDASKIPYLTITVTDYNSGLSDTINVRCISDVQSVSVSTSKVTF